MCAARCCSPLGIAHVASAHHVLRNRHKKQRITLQSGWESAGPGRVPGSPCSGTAPRPIDHHTLHRVAQQTQLSIANRARERSQDSPETAEHSHRATARVRGAMVERADFGDASARLEGRVKTPSPSGSLPGPSGLGECTWEKCSAPTNVTACCSRAMASARRTAPRIAAVTRPRAIADRSRGAGETACDVRRITRCRDRSVAHVHARLGTSLKRPRSHCEVGRLPTRAAV